MHSIGLNVRKLVALDMAFIGTRVIVAEYPAGVVLPALLAVLSLRQGNLLFGLPLLWIAVNYVPLFLHSVDLARKGTARQEVGGVLDRSYSWRQLWILVPFAVVLFALSQRSTRPA